MRLISSTALVALLCSVVISGLVAWALFWRIEEVEVVQPSETPPPVISRTVDLVGRQQGRDRWRLLSPEVVVENGQQVFDQGAHGYFYGNPEQRPERDPFFSNQDQMEWQASLARYDANADQLLLQNDVEVRDTDGSHLFTDLLRVTPEEAIDIAAPFTLTGSEVILSGQTGSFNFQFALMSATEGKLLVLPEGRPPAFELGLANIPLLEADPETTVITAAQLTYDRDAQLARGEGNLVIRERGVRIQAPEGTYDRRGSQSSLRGGVVLQETPTGGPREGLLADLSLAQSQPADTEEEVTIIADQLDYDRTTQIARGEGNLELRQGQTTIEAPQGSYRRIEAQSIMTGGVTLREPERILRSARLEGNHRDKIFLFEEDVLYTQMGTAGDPEGGGFSSEIRQSETEVKAARLVYNSRTETSEFTDNVEFIQRGRQAKADQARITPELVELIGDVEIQQIDGDWLAQRLESTEAQADVSRPTLIFANRVEIDQATSDARFYENVVIVQENRAAEGDRAVFYDGSQTFELIADGTPVLLCDRNDEAGSIARSTIEGLPGRDALDVTCRGANRIQSQLITLDMANDTFSASGQSQMQFRVTGDEAL